MVSFKHLKTEILSKTEKNTVKKRKEKKGLGSLEKEPNRLLGMKILIHIKNCLWFKHQVRHIQENWLTTGQI